MSRFIEMFTSRGGCGAILALVGCLLFLPADPGFSQEKTKIETIDDLPRHTYQIEGTVTELIESEEQLLGILEQAW